MQDQTMLVQELRPLHKKFVVSLLSMVVLCVVVISLSAYDLTRAQTVGPSQPITTIGCGSGRIHPSNLVYVHLSSTGIPGPNIWGDIRTSYTVPAGRVFVLLEVRRVSGDVVVADGAVAPDYVTGSVMYPLGVVFPAGTVFEIAPGGTGGVGTIMGYLQ